MAADSQVTDSWLRWFTNLVTPPFPNEHGDTAVVTLPSSTRSFRLKLDKASAKIFTFYHKLEFLGWKSYQQNYFRKGYKVPVASFWPDLRSWEAFSSHHFLQKKKSAQFTKLLVQHNPRLISSSIFRMPQNTNILLNKSVFQNYLWDFSSLLKGTKHNWRAL